MARGRILFKLIALCNSVLGIDPSLYLINGRVVVKLLGAIFEVGVFPGVFSLLYLILLRHDARHWLHHEFMLDVALG